MKRLLLITGTAFLLFLIFRAGASLAGANLPTTLDSRACQAAPTIDGVIHGDEWRNAPVHAFAIKMIRIDPFATETRPCELRVMNSANALYVALKVPDKTVDNTLTPLMLDAAVLAFGRDHRVQAHDDRRLIAQGIYRDKFVIAPGKGDGDDSHQDGLGAMTRENGVCSFEWALALDSGDADDLRAKPGDSVSFNVAYFDGFQLPLPKTWMGGAYSIHLDKADEWGTLRLAANVKNDGGKAFQSPAWVRAVAERLTSVNPSRLKVTADTLVPGSSSATAKLLVSFTYRDFHGQEKEARAKIYLPESIQTRKDAKFPLYFNAGYEMADGAEQEFIKRGWIVVSPRELESNPLIRTTNPDVALLHLARSIPWVDDARVSIGGGSAGGWMTLLLAAETFPLAGAAPDVPPVNLAYNIAYFFKQLDKAGPSKAGGPRVPALFSVGTMLKPSVGVYGEDYDNETWLADSPVAVASTITCPISVYFSTADILVPINQVGQQWVQPFDKSQFPDGFTMDPEKLLERRDHRLRLMDVLPESACEIFRLSIPPETSRHNQPGGAGHPTTCELPLSAGKLWSIAIIDEGPPVPDIDHRKYDLMPTRHAFFDHVAIGKIATDQLTTVKLDRLLARYAAKEWLPSRLKHLDTPESERTDIERGLRTYVMASPANAHRFVDLYTRLPADKQVLRPDFVNELKTRLASP